MDQTEPLSQPPAAAVDGPWPPWPYPWVRDVVADNSAIDSFLAGSLGLAILALLGAWYVDTSRERS